MRETALQAVIRDLETFVDPNRVKRRTRGCKQTTKAVREIIEEFLPEALRYLCEPVTMKQLADAIVLPDSREHDKALRWIVRVLCDETAQWNEDTGYRTRGFWQLKPEWR